MTSQGPHTPSSVGGGASPDGASAWVNPGNAGAGDDSFAAFTDYGGLSGVRSGTLTAEGFGFTLPTGATVTGVAVGVVAKAHLTGSPGFTVDASFESISILKPDNTASGDADPSYTGITNTATLYSWDDVGGDALWGLALSYSEINDSQFRVLVSVRIDEDNDITVFIDSISVTVDYTTGGGGSPVVASLTRTLGSITHLITAEKQRAGSVRSTVWEISCTSSARLHRVGAVSNSLGSIAVSAGGWKGTTKQGSVGAVLGPVLGVAAAATGTAASVGSVLGTITSRQTASVVHSLGSIGLTAVSMDLISASVSAQLDSITTDAIGFIQSCVLDYSLGSIEVISFAEKSEALQPVLGETVITLNSIVPFITAKTEVGVFGHVLGGGLGSIASSASGELTDAPTEERIGYLV